MPCVKSGARAGSLYRNLVAHALTLGASGDRAPVRQQPCTWVEGGGSMKSTEQKTLYKHKPLPGNNMQT